MSELRLKRHETFSIRDGWIEKGLNRVQKDPYCFRKDDATRNFGLGSNMVKSLRYWLMASGLVDFNVQKGASLTENGMFLHEVDPYLENDFSWWLIHYNLATSPNGDTSVIKVFFNMDYTKTEKELFFNIVKEKFEKEYGHINSESSLDADVTILFKSYYSEDDSNPENNLNCPLSRLGLVNLVNKKTYVKVCPSYSRLSYKLVYYSLVKCAPDEGEEGISLNLEDLIKIDNNPLKVFNLTKTMFWSYLEEMKKNGLINLVKTAGLNVISFDKVKKLRDIY